MSDLIVWAFGLDRLAPGDPGVEFSLARPLAGWAWVLLALAAAGASAWSYRRLMGPTGGRVALAAIRCTIIMLLLVLAAGPRLLKRNDRVERDWVLVLLDRSASLTIPDAATPTGAQTRDQQLRSALAEHSSMWAKLDASRSVAWYGFDSAAYELRSSRSAGGEWLGLDLPDARGRESNLGNALEQALRRAAARPIAGVVVLSDGRWSDAVDKSVLRRLQAERIPVVAVPLGDPRPVTDLAIERADAPTLAFQSDTVPVSVRLSRIGPASLGASGEIRVVDSATGIVLARERIPDAPEDWDSASHAAVTLTVKPTQPARSTWVVQIAPDAPDLIPANNRVEIPVEIVDRPLRVVYFDGYPRWEYRYVKNLLLREPLVSSSAMILAANRRYLQEGDAPMLSLPRSLEEWAPFDVIVMGDVRAELFSPEQLAQIREHVAVRGAGLLWIGGAGATPSSWARTPLADLLPFSLEPSEGGPTVSVWGEPVLMNRTPAAERLGLLELGDEGGWPDRLLDPQAGWSKIRWAQRINPGAVKPTAEALAVAVPASNQTNPTAQEPSPLVLTMRYGAGRVVYVATDETWRWRYARGEDLQERFWLPLIRSQGRESLARSGRPVALEVSPRQPMVEQPVRVAVQVFDQLLVDEHLPAISAIVREVPRPGEDGADLMEVSIKLAPEDIGSARAMTQSYAATWIPDHPGEYEVIIQDPALATHDLRQRIDVTFPEDELRRPDADHQAMATLADQDWGGSVMPVADLGQLPSLLPNRELRVAGAPDVETLWDRPIVLATLILLATCEWIGRRFMRLA